MKIYIKLFFALFLLCLLQYGFLTRLLPAGYTPNLLLVYVCLTMLEGRENKAYYAAFVGGIFAGLLTTTPPGLLGITMLSLILAGFYLKRFYIKDSFFGFLVFVLVSEYIYQFAFSHFSVPNIIGVLLTAGIFAVASFVRTRTTHYV